MHKNQNLSENTKYSGDAPPPPPPPPTTTEKKKKKEIEPSDSYMNGYNTGTPVSMAAGNVGLYAYS